MLESPPSVEETARRLLTFLSDATLRAAGDRLAAGATVKDITRELTADNPARVSEVFGVRADHPERPDFERCISNFLEDVIWSAARHTRPAASVAS